MILYVRFDGYNQAFAAIALIVRLWHIVAQQIQQHHKYLTFLQPMILRSTLCELRG